MTPFALSCLVTSVFSLFFGIFIYLKRRKSQVNQAWSFVCLSASLWSLALLVVVTARNKEVAFLGQYFLDVSAIFIPIFFLDFVLVLSKSKSRKNIMRVFYSLGIAISVISFSSLFKADMAPIFDFNYWIVPGPIYIILPIFYSLLVLYTSKVLIKSYLSLIGFYKGQMKYVLLASIFGLVGGASNFFPQLFKLYPYGNYLIILYVLSIAYAITKFRLMDIKTIIRRSSVFAGLVVIIGSLYIFLTEIISRLISFVFNQDFPLATSFLVAILISIGFSPLKKILERLTSKFLFKTTYNPDIVLSDISNVASSIVDLRQLLASISNILDSAFHCEKIAVAMLDKEGKLYLAHQQGFDPDALKNFTMGKEQVLPAYFSSSHEVQVIDELKTRYEAGEYQPKSVELLDSLYGMDIALVVPLFVKDEMIGVFVLGNKKSGEPYSHQDLNIIKIIAGQSAIAIENASLYDELKDYNVKLDQEVKKKTAELRKANEELKQLDEAKSEFISIASHQLRTPLTIIKGYISMMLEGNFGKVPVKINDNLKKVFSANERLINLVENLLDISRIESGRQEFNFSRARLEDMAAVVVDNFKNNAKDKNLILIFHKPSSPTPEVKLDADKIHEVMMNFVDNAIKYTKKGKVEVSVQANDGHVTYCVKDNGMGISSEVMPVLFQKFSRGKGSFRSHTEGLGLGLYVAKMMIDAHKGKIWAESDGEGKGSRFCFSLPIVK